MSNTKSALLGICALVFFSIAAFYFRGQEIKSLSDEKRLIPEEKITHGHGLAVDVADADILYIATHHGLLILKKEKDLYRIGSSYDDYMGFTPHPNDPKILYSSGHPRKGGNLGFQKSEDGGFTWKKIANGVGGPVDFHAMAISPVNPNLFYGWFQGNLQRSQDEGNTWEIVNRDLLVVQLTADPKDENVIYAATPNKKGVQVSRDKGVTWQGLSKELEGGQVAVISLNPSNNQEMLVFAEKLGGLEKSVDGGTTWKKVRENFNGETVLYIAFDKQNPDTIYLLTHENAIYKSVDGGETWSRVY